MPAGLRRAGHRLGAFAQQDGCDAGFARQEVQPAPGDRIERARHAGNLQQQRSHMGTAKNVVRGGQRFGRIGRLHKKERVRPPAQFHQALRMKRAIFQGFVIRPHPE